VPSLVLRERVLPDGRDAAINGPVSGAEAQRRRPSRGGTLSRSGGRFPLLGRNCNCNLFRLKQKIFRKNYSSCEGRIPL
jgi:hypothetical protein